MQYVWKRTFKNYSLVKKVERLLACFRNIMLLVKTAPGESEALEYKK